jgi:two-component system sensor histidine kinase KdpD
VSTRLFARRVGYPAAAALVLAVVGLLKLFPSLTDAAQALVLLLAVFVSAWIWESGPGVLAALLATLSFNFFFLPPLYTLTIQDPRNVIALGVFLAAALIVGRLSALARLRLRQVESERRELITLTRLSEAFFVDTNREALLGVAAERLHRALECRQVTILLVDRNGRLASHASSGGGGIRQDLAELAFSQGNSAAFPSAEGGTDIYLPIPLGVARVGTLVALGARASERLAEGCASLLGLALEREKFVRLAREAEETRAREEMKSTLLAALAHDLKTPVATARAALENWEAESGGSERSRLVQDSLKSLTRLIEDLLSVVRLEAGVTHPRSERVAAGAIAEAAVARIGDLVGEHAFYLDVPTEDVIVEADPAQITEALCLGLENAARYSPPRSEIRLLLRSKDGDVIFRVEDHGPGIPEKERERVMEKFVRLPATAGISGTGLGLYIARNLVVLNGGRIELGASAAGGTRFDIVLPRAA